MFEVRATFPFDDDWVVKSEIIYQYVLPFKHSFAGSGACRDMCNGREIGYMVPSFTDVVVLKKKLAESGINGLLIRVRECDTSHTTAG